MAAEMVTGQKIPVRVVPRRAGDPAVLIASSELIKKELGWQPEFQDLKLIIESAWKWMPASDPRDSVATDHSKHVTP